MNKFDQYCLFDLYVQRDFHNSEIQLFIIIIISLIFHFFTQIAVSDQWLSNIRLGLSDILQSKLG